MESARRPQTRPDREVQPVLAPTDPRLDCITKLAVMATGTSIGGVSLVFQSQMWVPGRYGVGDAYLPRVGSFCDTALEAGEDWFEVPDASNDPRFADNPVVAVARLCHYAAVLLRGAGGHVFGTLWVMGKEARTLDPDQAAQLRLLAEVAAETLNARYCDSATGLYKREVFSHHLQCLLDHAEDGAELTVGYVDLIGFRQLNHAVGRAQGDAILRLVGERIVAWGGLYGLTGHLGGDRFAFAMDAVLQDSAARIDALRDVLDAPFDTASGQRRLHARIGIVRHPAGGVLAGAHHAAHAGAHAGALFLLDGAEAAAHAVGHARSASVIREYDQGLRAGTQLRMELQALQRGAGDAGALEVHYQPQVDLAQGRLIGMEALVRWRHPVLGLLGPNRFIGLAEHAGDIVELDLHVLARVCTDLQAWLADGLVPAPVSLNASRATLLHPGVLPRIRDLLAQSGVPGHLLEVEVTESQLLEQPQLLSERVAALRALGLRIAVDDFGTGYSNLDTLSSFCFDRLKADRRFVHGVASNQRTAGLLTLIHGVATVFDAELLCEGVERQEDLDWLRGRDMGCVQGWYFSPARPAETVQGWLAGLGKCSNGRLDPVALRALLR